MGQWSYSLKDNDTVRDLMLEYKVAFHQFEPEKAVKLLDQYAASLFHADDEEMIRYKISLAMFLHKNGINHRSAIQRAIDIIDTLTEQENTNPEAQVFINRLIKEKDKLQQPLSNQKRVSLKLNLSPIYKTGDILTLELSTDSISQSARYIIVQKVGDYISWSSRIDPTIKDYWPIFHLFNYCGNKPTIENFKYASRLYEFYSDGSLSVYRKRHAEVIGYERVNKPVHKCTKYLFFSQKPDERILSIING